jgi:nucleotide-binding universal stress UspA family protein
VHSKILCAYDLSPGAERAFDFAVNMARRLGGELCVVSVFEPAEASRGVKSEALAETARQQFGAAHDELHSKAAAVNVRLETAVVVGSPAQQIVKRAGELRAEHIVLGQRGRNSHERSSVGSVALRVVALGAGTVTVVR